MTLTDYLLEKALLDLALVKSEMINTAQREKIEAARDIVREIIRQRNPF